MRAVLAIARRELKSFFVSPAAYVVTILFVVMVTVAFRNLFAQHVGSLISLPTTPGAQRPSLLEGVLQPLFVPGMFRALWLITPLITMRLLSEDRKQGTGDLLLTAPITTLQLVLGKYLGALIIMTVLLGLTVHIPAILVLRAGADGGVLLTGYLGLFLVSAMFLAAGTFASALTENQIVAAVLGLILMLGIFLSGLAAEASVGLLGGVFTSFSLPSKLEDFIRGILDSSGFVYFVTMSAFFIFLTQRVIDSQRWR